MTATRRTLHMLRAALLVTTVAALVGPVVAARRIHATASFVRDRATECIRQLAEAEADLVTADNAAIDSFRTQQAQLSRPGVQYENAISIASRRMAHVAELKSSGGTASQNLQLVQGLLVTYQGMIAQAHAHNREGAASPLAVAYLRNASELLHQEILVQLHDLQDGEQRALGRELARGSSNPLVDVLWVVPIVALLAMLVATQVFVARRFRRIFNALLAAATLVGFALAGLSSSAIVAERRLKEAESTMKQFTVDARANVEALAAPGQQSLDELVATACPACTSTTGGSGGASTTGGSGARKTSDRELIRAVQRADDRAAQAAGAGNVWLLGCLPAVIAVLVLGGLQPRIDEYRYRSR